MTTTVNNIEHIESQSLSGVAVVKIFLQPTADVTAGIAEVTSVSQAILKQLPPGVAPPEIVSYNATDVPVLRLGLGGKSFSEQQFNDYATNFVRPQLITVPGAAVPSPYGGKEKDVEVNLNYHAMQARGVTPSGGRWLTPGPGQLFTSPCQTSNYLRRTIRLRFKQPIYADRFGFIHSPDFRPRMDRNKSD